MKGSHMYIFPGYVKWYERDGAWYITSGLKQNTVKLIDKNYIAEFDSLRYNKGCRSLSTPLTKALHEQEFLLAPSEIERELCALKDSLSRDILLTIMPTEACNFRCTYCYEPHAPAFMSSDTIERIKEYIARQSETAENVHISWFGGEPTLCKESVLELSSFVQSLQKTYPVLYCGQMTTNGYLLDLDTFVKFYKVGITSYQITLDGWTHDLTRFLASGGQTLHTILDNLKQISLLPREAYEFSITLRRNILANDYDFSWYDFLYELFGKDDRFSVSVSTVNDWGGTSVKALSVAKQSGREHIKKAHEDYLDRIGLKRHDKSKELFSDVCYSSCTRGLIFRADGRIEKCTIALDNPQNVVGYVDPIQGVLVDESKNSRWSTADLKSECLTCPIVLSCLNIACRRKVIIDGHPESLPLCKKCAQPVNLG